MWINRDISEKILSLANARPAILLTGSRQAGKSSLLKSLFPNHEYHTLDRPLLGEQAESNPESFLRSFKNPVILDEIQYVPKLFPYLKILIDENRENYGHFILTGSQIFSMMKYVSESLAGRLGILHLDTCSVHELLENNVDVNSYLWKGGYPEIWSNPNLFHQDFYRDYTATYLERDIRSLIQVLDLRTFDRFLRSLALRTGQLMNASSIASEVGVSSVTIQKWTSALEASGIIHLLPPYFNNRLKRVLKTPKIYFKDIGLCCYLQGINTQEAWINSPTKGSLWENFVFGELIRLLNIEGTSSHLFFYRDKQAREIDFVLESDEKTFLMEAKLSENPSHWDGTINLLQDQFKNPVKILLHNGNINLPLKNSKEIRLNPLQKDFYNFFQS